ncbi:MAG: hypothetical protein ABI277_18170 [Burkholderiaceae bacterium]
MSPTPFTTAAKRVRRLIDLVLIALLCASSGAAVAALDPDAAATLWWDASRAERIDYSNTVAAACKPATCSSSEIRFCLNDVLKPPVPMTARDRSLVQATAYCIERSKGRK